MPLQRSGHVGVYSESSAAVTVTSGAANTKGAWAQMIASTAGDAGWVRITLNADIFVTATAVGALVDIGIGGAGAERVVIADVCFSSAGLGAMREFYLRVPAGSRIAVRMACVTASKAVGFVVGVGALPNFLDTPDVCTTYGAVASPANGTVITPGGTVNVYGVWTQIVASTTNPINWLAWSTGQSTTASLLNTGKIEIGYGPSGSEQTLISGIWTRQTGAEEFNGAGGCYPVYIPAASRLVARMQQSVLTAGVALCIHGLA